MNLKEAVQAQNKISELLSYIVRYLSDEDYVITVTEKDVDKLMEIILTNKAKNDIEGVSFIGGEPILQAEGLAELAFKCQDKGLSVLIFTGYRYKDLLTMKDNNVNLLLKNTDILVDGEFVETLYDRERLGWLYKSARDISQQSL